MLLLPRNNRLHYSDWTTWRSSKSTYRKRFFGNKDSLNVPAIKFGAEIARLLDENPDNSLVRDIPRFEFSEFCLDPLVEGVQIETHPDGFSLKSETYLQIVEYKTALIGEKGVWTQKKVLSHDQLVFYCWATYHKYGSYNPIVYLVEIPTERETSSTIEGVTWNNCGDKKHLKINRAKLPDGSYVPVNIFKREVTMIEIERIHKDIMDAAREISSEYTEYVQKLLAELD